MQGGGGPVAGGVQPVLVACEEEGAPAPALLSAKLPELLELELSLSPSGAHKKTVGT